MIDISEAVARWSREDQLSFEERAAIMHFDGGMPVADAEQKAFRIVKEARRKSFQESK